MLDNGVDREERFEAVLERRMLGREPSEDLMEVDESSLSPDLLRSDPSDVVEGRAAKTWCEARGVVAEGEEDLVTLGRVVGRELSST